MGLLWFSLVAVMLAVYVVLDGFDLGVGALHLFVGRNDDERRMMLHTIGPVWDGNEVWLLASGRRALLRLPAAVRIQLQRLLSAADDGAVAADAARARPRVPHPYR